MNILNTMIFIEVFSRSNDIPRCLEFGEQSSCYWRKKGEREEKKEILCSCVLREKK